MENKSGEFEASLARLEAIVKQLESEEVDLDRSVQLFREGRDLARKCEALLKGFQEKIDAEVGGSAGGATAGP